MSVLERLIIGLGNPGPEYADNRHNAGWRVVEALAANADAWFGESDSVEALTCSVVLAQEHALLVKPQAYMNRSGLPVSMLLEEHELSPDQALVVVDDYNLPLGRLRFRARGSDGGHNGLRNIAECVGDGFHRLRLGIGPLPKKQDGEGGGVIDFVLSAFDESEIGMVDAMTQRAAKAAADWVENGIEMCQNVYNSADVGDTAPEASQQEERS